jgi:hypothetical protein
MLVVVVGHCRGDIFEPAIDLFMDVLLWGSKRGGCVAWTILLRRNSVNLVTEILLQLNSLQLMVELLEKLFRIEEIIAAN